MKKVVQIVLALAIVALAFILYNQMMAPVRFQKEVTIREQAVIKRIKEIRTAEQAYKSKYQRYTGSFDTLLNFILNDSLVFERSIGDKNDSIAVAKGLVRSEKFSMAVKDTLFKMNRNEIMKLPYIPYSDNVKFILNAGLFTTESSVVVPVFECKAPYKDFLGNLDRYEQLLINLIDDQKTLNRYPGIKVGSMTQATNDAGNWE